MTFRLRFGVALISGLCVLLAGLAAGASERSVDSGKPAAAKGPAAIPKVAEFELIEYVPAAVAPERAGSPPPLATPPRSVQGDAAGTAEVEPNGTFATATALTGNNTQAHGNIFPAADVDFYSFSALAGDRVYAATQTAFDASASGNSNLQLLASDGVTVIETDVNDGSFNASSSSIAGALIPSDGTYYLRVSHNVATGTIRPYTLHLRVQTGPPAPEVEPNNTPATATPLNGAGHMTGTISAVSPGESDFYSLSLNAGDSVYLSLDMNPERDAAVWNGRLGLGLFGNPPSNQILLANDANGGAAPADPNSEAFFFTVKDAGTYFIYIDSVVAAGLGANATYNLSVAVTPRQIPPGVCTTHVSTDVPQTIPTGPGLVSSTITVPGNPRIADLDVAINLNHTFMQDLDVHLVSPAGNDNGLFTDIGAATVGGAQTLMDLVIDDEAALPPTFAMTAPFHIRPELAYRLSWFDGSDGGGTWTLVIRDDATGDGGTLNSWSITICEPLPPPSCPAGTVEQVAYSSDFESGDGGFTHSGVADEWELGLPSFAPITTCNSGTNCWKTDLDNSYNASSNQNLLSPNIDLTGLQPPVLVRWAQRYHLESATFDQYSVDAREAGGANPVRLFEWLDATMNNTVGAGPAVTIAESSGWSQMTRQVDSLAGTTAELLFNLTSDTTVQLAGVAIDDVSVSACRPLAADLSITKTDGAASAIPGTPVTYTIVAANDGPDAVASATVADTFPAILSGCSWTCSGAGGGTCTAGPVAGNINDAAVVLPVGASVTYTATCNIAASATGSLINTATVSSAITDPVPGNNSATDTNTLTPQADLAISKTNGVATSTPGTNTVYTIVASNPGPSDAPGSTVTDSFPAACIGVTWTCAGAGGATCSANGAGNINDVVNLPAGGSVTYTATCPIDPAAVGTLANTASVASAGGLTDPNPANNSATDSDTLGASADVSLTKVATGVPDPLVVGSAFAYTLTASNAGPSTATAVVVSDSLPANLAYVSNSCGATFAAPTLTWNIGVLAAGANASCTLNVTVSDAGEISNTATIVTATTDPNGANNASTAVLAGVPATADMVIALTSSAGFGTLGIGDSFNYTVTGTNNGPGEALGLAFTLELSGQVSFVSSTCGAVLNVTTLSWNVASLANGASTSCVITVTVVLGGEIPASASVSTTSVDPDLSNNTASLVVGTAAVPVPAFGTLGLLLLGLLLGGFGVLAIRR